MPASMGSHVFKSRPLHYQCSALTSWATCPTVSLP